MAYGREAWNQNVGLWNVRADEAPKIVFYHGFKCSGFIRELLFRTLVYMVHLIVYVFFDSSLSLFSDLCLEIY